MENIFSFLADGYLMVAIVTGILAEIIKKTFMTKHTKLVPLVVIALGVFFGILYSGIMLGNGFTNRAVLIGVEQGILSAAIAITGFDMLKGIAKIDEQNN